MGFYKPQRKRVPEFKVDPESPLSLEEQVQDRHDKCLTVQADIEHTDINRLVQRADNTGILANLRNTQLQFGESPDVNEYQDALNLVARAQSQFQKLPAELREKFGNDPGTFVEFVTNPANAQTIQDAGVAIPRAADPLKEMRHLLAKIAEQGQAATRPATEPTGGTA